MKKEKQQIQTPWYHSVAADAKHNKLYNKLYVLVTFLKKTKARRNESLILCILISTFQQSIKCQYLPCNERIQCFFLHLWVQSKARQVNQSAEAVYVQRQQVPPCDLEERK